jgi:hypothetical protein
MGRPKKSNPDDMDAYNETALNLDNVEQGTDPETPYDSETDDVLPELGERELQGRFDGASDDEEMFENLRD